VRTERWPGEFGETLEPGRCNGESEVRQMEVAGVSTLHCTGDEGREGERGGGGDENQDTLHDIRPRVEIWLWLVLGVVPPRCAS
jgi:hypothetical protein